MRKPRIVSLLPGATEIVCALGLELQLVGVSHECNWPAQVADKPRVTRSKVDSTATSNQIDVQVKELLQANRALYEIDVELLVALRPDLIVTQAQCDVCAVSLDTVQHAVAQHSSLAGTRIVALSPNSLDDLLNDVLRVGNAAGVELAAEQFRDALKQRIDVVDERAPTKRPRTVVIEWTDPLMIAGNWTPELVATAGGDYGLVRPRAASRYVEWQEILEYSPEVVVVAPCGFDLQRSQAELVGLEALPGWENLPAVQAGRVHVVDGDAFFNRPGPRLVDSLEMLANWLHR